MKNLAITLMMASIACYTASAWAYMDPGGTNLFLQLVLPVLSMIVGFFVFMRRWLMAAMFSLYGHACAWIRRVLGLD